MHNPLKPATLLRRALQIDAVATGATAMLAIAAAGPLGDLLGLPAALLRIAGLVLLPFVGLVAWAALRERVPLGAVRAIIGANGAWVVASLALVLGPWVAPNTLGVVFIAGQAGIVALFAALQIAGLGGRTAAAT